MRPILHQHTKFHKDRSNRCMDIAIFCDFQDGGRCHFGLSKIRNFNISSAVGANMCHRAKFYQNWSNSCRDMAIYLFY